MTPILNPATFDAYAAVAQGFHVRRPSAVVPAAAGSQNLFINTGPVLLTGLVGVTTVPADAGAELLAAYIGASGAVNIAAVSTTIAVAVLGTLFYITGVFATGLVIALPTLPTAIVTSMPVPMINPVVWPCGATPLNLGIVGSVASNLTLSIEWHCWYRPLAAGAGVNVV